MELQKQQQQQMNTMKSARVVIIGAGVSGIAAATRLIQSGFENVVLLEAENRYGGRIHTIPWGENVVDLGAQWCHGERDNVVYELVRDLELLSPITDRCDDYKCVRSNKEVVPDSVTQRLQSIAYNLIPDRQAGLKKFKGSLGSYLTEMYWRELQETAPDIDKTVAHEFFENFKWYECTEKGSDHLFDVSGKSHLDYWFCEGEQLINWQHNGFGSVLRVLMNAKKDDPNDLGLLNKRIKYNAYVENIEWKTRHSGVHLRLRSGELIEADHVICTVSLGVLKANHEKMFTPTLPFAKSLAIEALDIGTIDKFFLEFEQPFKPLDWPAFCLLWRAEELSELRKSDYYWLESVFGFFRVASQPQLLLGWVIGPDARHMETLPEAEVLTALQWLFKKFLTFEVPTPKRFLRTRWYSNPNFRGSYSFHTLRADEARIGFADLAAPLVDEKNGKPLLQFAGEATHPHFYSTVNGAVESGWREAQRLIAHYYLHPNAQL